MRGSSSHLNPGIDHPEERLHRLSVDDSLFEAIAHRLETVGKQLKEHLGNPQAGPLCDRIKTVEAEVSQLKGEIEAFYEKGPFDQVQHRLMHAATLELADQAESLTHGFEESPDQAKVLATTAMRLDEMEQLIDQCQRRLKGST